MRFSKRLAVLVCSLALAGCTSGNDAASDGDLPVEVTAPDLPAGCVAVEVPDDPAQAVALADASITEDPANADAYSLRGSGLLRQGLFAEAAEAFSGAIALDPECGPYHAGLGVALTALGSQDADAASALDIAVELGVTTAELDLNRGVLLARAGDLASAVERFEASVASQPSAIGWLNLGRARLGLGEVSAALEALDASLELDDSNGQAHALRGDALVALGDQEAADQAYAAAVDRGFDVTPVDPVGEAAAPESEPEEAPDAEVEEVAEGEAAVGVEAASSIEPLSSEELAVQGLGGELVETDGPALVAFCSEPLAAEADVFSNGVVTQWIFNDSSAGQELFAAATPGCLYRGGDGAARELRAIADIGNGLTLFEIAVLDGDSAGEVTGGVRRIGDVITVIELNGPLEANYLVLRELLGAG